MNEVDATIAAVREAYAPGAEADEIDGLAPHRLVGCSMCGMGVQNRSFHNCQDKKRREWRNRDFGRNFLDNLHKKKASKRRGAMICKICKSKSNQIFQKTILEKYKVTYYQCEECGFVQTEEPFWLIEAYNLPINKSDTGYMLRNLRFANKLKYYLKKNKVKNAKYLDYGAGYGVFVRLMRDLNFDFRWSDDYCENVFAKGFETSHKDERFEVITMFEVAEHLVDPMPILQELSKSSNSIIFSTEIIPNTIRSLENWWYLGVNHGQHVSLWSRRSLEEAARRLNMKLHSLGSIHILTKYELSILDKLILKLSGQTSKLEQKFFGSLIWSDYETSARD